VRAAEFSLRCGEAIIIPLRVRTERKDRQMPETIDPLDQPVNVNFKMTERDRRAFKVWCTQNGLTLTDGFLSGIALLRGMRDLVGPEPVETLLGTLRSASVFLIDQDSDLRVERRGAEAWAVCEGASIVNRDGGREPEPMPSSRDEAFIARTRFPLAEALRIARARAGVDE